MMQRQRVMLPQVLLVDDLEAGVVQRRLDEPGRGEVAVGEDVSVEELVRSGPVVRLVLGDRDLVVEQAAGRLEQLEHLIEVVAVVLRAHMFHHAHRGDAVEVSFRHFAVVHHAQLGQILQPFAPDPLLTVLDLLVRQRYAQCLDAALGCGDDQSAPAASDVEHAVAGLEVQLVEHQVDFVALRVIQAHVGRVEHRARVRHRRSDEVGVELVRQVIMEADGLGVGLFGVREQTGLDAFEFRGAFGLRHLHLVVAVAENGRPHARQFERRWLSDVRCQFDELAQLRIRVGHVQSFDVEVAQDVCAGQTDLVQVARQLIDGLRTGDPDLQVGVFRPERRSVEGFDAHRRVLFEDRLRHFTYQHGFPTAHVSPLFPTTVPCRIWQSPCHCSPASSFFALRGNKNAHYACIGQPLCDRSL